MKKPETPAECVARMHRQVKRARARLAYHESAGPIWNLFLRTVENAAEEYKLLNQFEKKRQEKPE